MLLVRNVYVAVGRGIRVGEPELTRLNALVDCFVELEDVDAALAACAGKQVQSGVEHNRLDFSLAITSLQLLYAVTPVSAKQLDDVTSVACRSY